MKTLPTIFWRALFKIIIKNTPMKLWRKVWCNVEDFLPPFWLITYYTDRTEQLLPANNRVLKLVANLNVINESVLFSSCHISLLISIHFAYMRSFYLVVLTQFCYFKITPVCELVATGNIWKTRHYLQNVMPIHDCYSLQEWISVFSKYASHSGHGISEKFF